MRAALFVPLFLTAACAIARSLECGLTLYQLPRASTGERVVYRFNDGIAWHMAEPRTKWADQPLYDYRIKPWGTVTVESLLLRDGTRISKLILTIPSRGDMRYAVHAEVGPDDPTRACFGCSKAVSAPISGNPNARFWLWYGFNGISHPMIF
jgi:hypothetical protein